MKKRIYIESWNCLLNIDTVLHILKLNWFNSNLVNIQTDIGIKEIRLNLLIYMFSHYYPFQKTQEFYDLY